MLMKQAELARWLKGILLGVGLCGIVVYGLVIPMLGQALAAAENGVFDHCYWPWLLFIWATGIPCYIALALAWRLAANIGADRSFSMDNARLLRWISWLAAGDAAFFFVGNVVLWLLSMNHPGIVLFSLVVVFAGVSVAVASAVLAHLVEKAAELQEQSDGTI